MEYLSSGVVERLLRYSNTHILKYSSTYCPSLPHRTGIKGTLQRTMVQHEQYTETPSINQLRIVRGIGDPRIDFSLEDLMVFLLPERENNKKVPMDGYLP